MAVDPSADYGVHSKPIPHRITLVQGGSVGASLLLCVPAQWVFFSLDEMVVQLKGVMGMAANESIYSNCYFPYCLTSPIIRLFQQMRSGITVLNHNINPTEI